MSLDHTDSDDYVEDIKKIEQHKFHPKEDDVEYYSNHMIYKNDEHKPKDFIEFLEHNCSSILLPLMLLDALQYSDENKNYAIHRKYSFQIGLISTNRNS